MSLENNGSVAAVLIMGAGCALLLSMALMLAAPVAALVFAVLYWQFWLEIRVLKWDRVEHDRQQVITDRVRANRKAYNPYGAWP